MVTIGFKGNEFDYESLEENIKTYANKFKIGSFNAASNITGKILDVNKIASICKKYDCLTFFDFAASAPYVKIDVNHKGSEFDGVFISPHKFLGGPGNK